MKKFEIEVVSPTVNTVQVQAGYVSISARGDLEFWTEKESPYNSPALLAAFAADTWARFKEQL